MESLVNSIKGSTLSTISTPLRVLFTCFLGTIGIGYLTALLYLFLVDVDPHLKMGMGVAEGISMKYHGQQGNTRLEAALRGSMADRLGSDDKEQIMNWLRGGATTADFEKVKPIFVKKCVACHSPGSGLPVPPFTTFDEVRKVAAVDTGPSFGQLARVSHVHLFGISIIFLLTGGIFALTQVSGTLRLAIIAMPYLAIWADIGSWWITKYLPIFAYVVLIGGGLMGLALAAQIIISLWEMWFRNPSVAPPARG
jgi:hypothetical protein